MHDTSTPIPAASKRLNEMVSYVRQFTRDFPELNRLIRGEETSSRQIAWAVLDAVDDWNTTPPFLGRVGLENFPSIPALREGAVATLLKSVAMLQLRNQLDYSDGGIQVSSSNKGPVLMQWAQLYQENYERKRDRIKASLNVEFAMGGGGVFSEYFVISGSYLSLG